MRARSVGSRDAAARGASRRRTGRWGGPGPGHRRPRCRSRPRPPCPPASGRSSRGLPTELGPTPPAGPGRPAVRLIVLRKRIRCERRADSRQRLMSALGGSRGSTGAKRTAAPRPATQSPARTECIDELRDADFRDRWLLDLWRVPDGPRAEHREAVRFALAGVARARGEPRPPCPPGRRRGGRGPDAHVTLRQGRRLRRPAARSRFAAGPAGGAWVWRVAATERPPGYSARLALLLVSPQMPQ